MAMRFIGTELLFYALPAAPGGTWLGGRVERIYFRLQIVDFKLGFGRFSI